MRFLAASLSSCLLLHLAFAPVPAAAQDAVEDAAAPGVERQAADGPVRAERYMAVAANPHASAAGLEILRAGGSAADAAIAMQMVLGLVEPQSSGIGGGGFLLHYDRTTGDVIAYDGRETAPAAVDETLFLGEDGEPMGFIEAAFGGRAVGTPGAVMMLALVHAEQGERDWARLFAPAIKLAEQGFEISPRLFGLLSDRAEFYRERGFTLEDLGPAGPYFFTEALEAKPQGTVLKNPHYAATLRTIAEEGYQGFYQGEIAESIVKAVRTNPLGPGKLSLDDLADYRPVKKEPVCGHYRARRVCSMGPPSSGATTMLAILGILEGYDMAALDPLSAEAVHLFAEASRLAYADRGAYTGDADFVDVPVAGLVDKDYLAKRRRLIDREAAMTEAPAGTPPGVKIEAAADAGPEGPSTSHLVAVDKLGNAVSFTTTVQIAFGSFVMTEGFLLNNQLTDFSFRPTKEDQPVANRVQPGKKPRSSMSPTLGFDTLGRLDFAVGSPGGSRIIDYVTKAVIALIDWDMDIQAAISHPNMVGKDGVTELEAGTPLADLAPHLEAMGHQVRVRSLNSGLHGFRIHHQFAPADIYYAGGADPRREGVPMGD